MTEPANVAPEPYAVDVPDLDSVWLAVACENYTTADLAVWKARTAIGQRTPTRVERGHLDELNARRYHAYTALVGWMDLAEAARIRAEQQPERGQHDS